MSPSSGYSNTWLPKLYGWSTVIKFLTDSISTSNRKGTCTGTKWWSYLPRELWEVREKIWKTAYLFDRYGPSTAYAVCFTVNALCLFTGFPWLQENKKLSQQLQRHSDEEAEWKLWGLRWVWVGVCMLGYVCEGERERLGVRDEGRGSEGLCLSICSSCGETRRCKIKVSKEARN